MMRSEARGRPVFSTQTSSTVGTVDDLVIDAAAGRVVALRLVGNVGAGDVLPWQNVKAFGPDAVIVDSADEVVEATGTAALPHERTDVVGKRLLTDGGADLGEVTDVSFDPHDGHVQALVTGNGSVAAEEVIGCGDYAVLVQQKRPTG